MIITISFIALFTLIFLMSKINVQIFLVMFSVFILPFFYAYFPILPNAVKIITDIYLFIFVLYFIISNRLAKVIMYNKITVFLLIYMAVFVMIVVLSSITNNSDSVLVLLEIRTVLFPFVIICIFNYYEILKGKEYQFEVLLKYIFMLQVFLIPMQYLLYDFYYRYMVTTMHQIDAASGTFGIGTSMIGVFIVLYFIYSFMSSKIIISIFSLLPLPFVFSGGGNILLVVSFFLVLLVQKINTKMILNIFFITLGIILFTVLFFAYVFDRNPIIESYEYISTGFEKTTTEEEMFTAGNYKLSRLYGPLYAIDMISQYDKKILGFGPSVYATSTSLGVSTNLFDIGEIINLVPELLLKYGYSGLLVNIFLYMFLIGYFFRKRKINNYYAISFIFSVVYLLNFMYTKPIYQPAFNCFVFFIYYKACSLEKAQRIHNEESIYNNTYVQTPVKA